MKGETVFDNGFLFSIEFPEAKEDMVEFDDMMDLKVLSGITLKTGDGSIPFYPIRVDIGGTDMFLHSSNIGLSAHAL
jgi:hypothetical protein